MPQDIQLTQTVNQYLASVRDLFLIEERQLHMQPTQLEIYDEYDGTHFKNETMQILHSFELFTDFQRYFYYTYIDWNSVQFWTNKDMKICKIAISQKAMIDQQQRRNTLIKV